MSGKLHNTTAPKTVVIEDHSSDSEIDEETPKEITLQPKRLRCAVSFRADDTDKWGGQALDARENYILSLRNPTVKAELLERLDTFRRNRELCDVVLFVREREIFAHKVVLAAVSPALSDLFLKDNQDRVRANSNGSSSPTNPAAPDCSEKAYFEFAQTDYDCFSALVNYAYTSYLEINNKKVAELYKTAYALQMHQVAKACAKYLADNLSVHNCLGIRLRANFNKDMYLMDQVDKYISENFSAIAESSEEFSSLAVIKSRIIISGEELKRDNIGQSLAERTLHYFEHYKAAQKSADSFDYITGKTHLLYLEEGNLADCAEMDDRSSVGSCDLIKDYKKSGKRHEFPHNGHIDPPFVGTSHSRTTGATAVRLDAKKVVGDQYGSTESLDSVASEESEPENTISARLLAVHQTSPDYWMALVVLYYRLMVISIQVSDDEEISAGKKERSGSVDAQKQQLLNKLVSSVGAQRKPLPTMNAGRCSTGAVFLEGKIIVCGGYDRGECLNSVEEYDVVNGTWRHLKPMQNERGRFDTAVVNGKVYAIAGSNGHKELKSAECYDPKTGKWSNIASLARPRSHNGCAVVNDVIYCIGGCNAEQVCMKDCERYDPAVNEWAPMAPLSVGRYQAAAVAWKGMVLAIGGCDRWSACLDTVEAYDPKSDTWREMPKLRTPRRGCAVAVVRDVLYLIGGHDGTNSLTTVDILDHPSGTWRAGPALTNPRANTHAVVTAGNVIYVIGGFNKNSFLDSIELLESESVGWRNYQQSTVSFTLAEGDEESETAEDVQNGVQNLNLTPVKAK
ncbi:unnamed protein product, partial [Mesorhabditis spiculigera]